MSKDLAPILAGWDFDPGELQVRIITGLDGREKLQLRIDLGLLQMERDGRPDGLRPQGCESLLDWHETRAAAAAPEPYLLDPEDCAALLREGLQYYHRYLSLFHLGRYDLVARDTARNLRLFRFVCQHATRAEDRFAFDQYRPYVTMMYSRAVGMQALERGDDRAALRAIDEGIAAIEAFATEYRREAPDGGQRELSFLRGWRLEIERGRKRGPVERLEAQLELAVAREDYEEAARLRDQIRRLRAAPPRRRPSSGGRSP